MNLTLVSCVGLKLDHAAPAADLYRSQWFLKARRYAESQGEWRILSALHGVLHSDEMTEPYERTLNTLPEAERRAWSEMVAPQILALSPSSATFLAGAHYRKHLIPELEKHGIRCHVPMRGLGIGQQLAWLGAQK